MVDESWRNRFREYATSAAFQLTLTKPQYQALNRMAKMEDAIEEFKIKEKRDLITMWTLFDPQSARLPSLTALERRGFIRHDGDGWHVTRAGRIVLQLVYIAFPEEKNWKPKCMYSKMVEIPK